jgi:signal transduction histidine kinase
LSVRDWGVGFDPKNVAEQRFGLQGMRERVRLLGGRIVIESTPHEGTRVMVDLPLVEDTSGDATDDDE